MTTALGIDPGASGGIAFSWYTGDPVGAEPMPSESGLLSIMEELAEDNSGRIAVIEEVGGFIGGKGNPGSAMFKFGRNFGFVLGVLQAHQFQIHLLKPQKWQKTLGLGTSKGMTKTQWKNKLKDRAAQLFPNIKVTLKTADALLIYQAGRELGMIP